MVTKTISKAGRKGKSEAWLKKNLPEIMKGTGGIASVIAKKLKVDISTVFRYCQKYPWINELRHQEREVIVDVAESKLFKKVQEEEDWAIKYTLSKLGAHRGYSDKVQHEVTGVVGHVDVKVVRVEKQEDFIDN